MMASNEIVNWVEVVNGDGLDMTAFHNNYVVELYQGEAATSFNIGEVVQLCNHILVNGVPDETNYYDISLGENVYTYSITYTPLDGTDMWEVGIDGWWFTFEAEHLMALRRFVKPVV